MGFKLPPIFKDVDVYECSFCGEKVHKSADIIVAAKANICSKCVLFCTHLIIAQHPEFLKTITSEVKAESYI